MQIDANLALFGHEAQAKDVSSALHRGPAAAPAMSMHSVDMSSQRAQFSNKEHAAK